MTERPISAERPVGAQVYARWTTGHGPLREEFIVCRAAGYPDPYRPHPNTREEALRFANEHSVNASTGERVEPIVRRRVVSDWQDVVR